MYRNTNEKRTKDKHTITIHKILHIILKTLKMIYEISKVLKSIINLFL